MTLAANVFLTVYVYTRLPQQSAYLFRAVPSSQFDIRHPWLETGASLSTGTIVYRVGRHTMAKIGQPLALLALYLANPIEILCHINTRGPQHVSEEDG